ncbi:unnamed protein product [Parascedosporium putredinis]|uniref:F-box domain-containing protein n=1 Tax=Parascedosporium putredinis TaxID=1442378 RepID=A0A9P1M6Y9_9PEZI|nr:unnamed protein product [Parascedosporium putredinis]CAI7989393.1 unnamed protein product [Parascedosporium putredinis]
MTPPRLPVELILQIVESVIPDSPDALLRRDDPRSRLLIAFTLVCRSTYRVATRLLRKHSASIESSNQLRRMLLSLDGPHYSPDPALSWKSITSLYLAPFGNTLDDLPTARWVNELCHHTADTLRRLVIDMPFSTLDRYDDHLNVRQVLRQGFESLVNLEEFICLSEYPQLSTSEATTDIWALWPNLKRLMLFHVPLADHWLWWNIARLRDLEFVWFMEPKPGVYARCAPDLQKKFTVAVAGCWYTEDVYLMSKWEELDPDECMTFRFFSQGLPDDVGQIRKRWLTRNIENGSLWDLDAASRYMGNGGRAVARGPSREIGGWAPLSRCLPAQRV